MTKRELKSLQNFAVERLDQLLIWVQIENTEGSTYRKKGANKLIDQKGQAVGLLSGGCLERDILQKALSMEQDIELHSFQTQAEEDRFFGYGLGCQGKIHLKFQKVESRQIIDELKRIEEKLQIDVAVIGAGPDIDPLWDLMSWMNWNLQFYTLDSERLSERREQNWPIQELTRSQLRDFLSNGKRKVLLLMSHNYPADLEALSFVHDLSLSYIGVLGPTSRKQKLIEDLKKVYDLEWPKEELSIFHGPVGLSGFGQGEDAIALSIVAQIQSLFFGKDEF